ncbi:cytochrome P460 family protein [Thalassomonas sp. RHCl1]|uniref:cytochrome P460 family protein n=1 Tax=Thalassomonas sp. RHCl1 TaxID=2995320 RepID=UPI00248D19F1|nr:cytochrome P460 family protein [Thalassomonas sp. RHCl1]
MHNIEKIRAVLIYARICVIAFILIGCKAGDGKGLDANGQPLVEDTPEPVIGLFVQIQDDIFTARCIACHIGAQAPQGLDLSEGNAYGNIVGVASNQQPTLNLIEPDEPELSYLVKKIRGDEDISGGQMPLSGPPFLDDSQIQLVIDWVNDGAPPPQVATPAEFVAELSDFSAYGSWSAIDYSIGATNNALGGAHQAQDDNYSRRVYANALALTATDSYPNGSIFVKEVTSWQNGEREFSAAGGLLAMVKRGGEFNPGNSGWEWFELNPDVSEIVGRGGNLMDDGCNTCHSLANSQSGGRDYVFEHPSEYQADNSDFADFRSWSEIEERSDQNPLLGGMAHGGDNPDSTRRIFKKQLYANPDSMEQGYPIGTILVKEVEQEGVIVEITAMVKRGGDFSPDHQDWEWFMLDPDSLEIMLDDNGDETRGANLMDGMCASCHSQANPDSGYGKDYVFHHENDPFNFADMAIFTRLKATTNN